MVATSLTRALEVCADSAVAASSGDRLSGGDVRVGVDVVLIADVRDSIAAFGPGYLQRIYTEQELIDCGDSTAPMAASRLAARFAVKEAVTKVLGPRDAPGWWRDIETVRSSTGACELRLLGAAAADAARMTLSGWGVSLTHEWEYSAAVVVARTARSQRQVPQEAEA